MRTSERRHPLAALIVLAALPLAPVPARAWPAHPDSGGVPVSTAPQSQWYQAAIPDGAGGVFVTWRDDRKATPSLQDYDVYAQRLTALGAPLWAADGAPVCTNTSMQDRPAACADGTGGLYAAWTDARGTDADVYAQHLGANAARLWTLDGYRISRDAGAEDNVSVVPSAGGCIVVWQHTAPAAPGARRVFAQRLDAAGAIRWTYGGVPVPGPGPDQTQPASVADGADGVIVGWVQPTFPRVIRAQRLSAAGTPLWGAGGIAVSDSSLTHSSTFWMRGDGAGGAWFVVHDQSSATTPWLRHVDAAGATLSNAPVLPAAVGAWVVNAFAAGDSGRSLLLATNGNFEVVQRVSAAGALEWTPHGLPATDSETARLIGFAVTSDGGAGAMVLGTALDTLTGHREVRAQRVRADGTRAWATRGVTLADAVLGAMRNPVAVPSGEGAIAVWADERAYATRWLDLYAQRIDASGALGSPTLGVPAPAGGELAFAPPAPNPLRPGGRVTLAFSLPGPGRATLALYDLAGRRVRALLAGERPAGPQRVAWDGRDEGGREAAAGVYFARLEYGGRALTRRIVALD